MGERILLLRIPDTGISLKMHVHVPPAMTHSNDHAEGQGGQEADLGGGSGEQWGVIGSKMNHKGLPWLVRD